MGNQMQAMKKILAINFQEIMAWDIFWIYDTGVQIRFLDYGDNRSKFTNISFGGYNFIFKQKLIDNQIFNSIFYNSVFKTIHKYHKIK